MNRILPRVGLSLLLLVLSVGAFAKSRTENITLYHDATLNGTKVPAGEYMVRYEMDGSNAQVTILKGRKEVASATGQVKTLDQKVSANQVVLQNDSSVPRISEIDFGGKTAAISFEGGTTAAGK